MTRPTGEDEMIEMTDERAAEVLAAHNAWRRYDGLPGEPGAPAMGDPAELGRAIDHVVSRLRSKPPAEAQPSAPVGVEAQPGAGLDVEAVLRQFLTGDGFIAECDIQHIVAALTAQPAISGYTCTVPDDCETLHWRGQILSMNELAALAQQPAAVEGAAMKEDTLEHQLEHCDGKDCTCAAYGECECACGADWTPAEVYLLRDKVEALSKDAERIRWLAANMRRIYGWREFGGYELPDIATVESYREYCDPQHLRAAIDAAMNGANA